MSTEWNDAKAKLVTRMMDANFKASKTPYSYPPNMVEGMGAALDAALEEFRQRVAKVLCEPPDEFFAQACDRYVTMVDDYLLAQYTKPKTIEDRVTVVEWIHSNCPANKWIVLLDGANMRESQTFAEKEHGEIYRLGWIAKLKAEDK